ncbi:hypothetical protein PG991_003324 [Apiospora marii]|uniref:Uncharacterized protein n=1 Tax=Apiospora marii TaxID=335849 RepID=A0ABR1SHW7_9PEZI
MSEVCAAALQVVDLAAQLVLDMLQDSTGAIDHPGPLGGLGGHGKNQGIQPSQQGHETLPNRSEVRDRVGGRDNGGGGGPLVGLFIEEGGELLPEIKPQLGLDRLVVVAE